jgi:cytochrome b
MDRILVWDLPARLFHLAFAGSIGAAIGIAFLADHEQPLFQWHMLFGIVALFLVAVRVLMGLVGSRYSRFSSFPVHPREVTGYMVNAVFAKTRHYAGNNPGSAMAAVFMFLLVPALFLSGIGGESFEELHELFAWSLLAVIVMHLLGLAWHTLRHRENISLAMVTGKKPGETEDGIASAHVVWGAVILIATGLWITALFANHNSKAATVKLPAIGVTLPLGENESAAGKPRRDRDDDD